MTSTSIEIKERIHRLIDESDDTILRDIEQMLEKHQQAQFWDDDEIDALNRDIEESERQIEAGNFITNNELKLKMKNW